MSHWHTRSIQTLAKELETSVSQGLSSATAEERLLSAGYNKLPEGKVDSIFIIFLRQFQSPLIYILLIAGGVMIFLHEVTDAIIVLLVLVFNAIIGAIQEGKAQNVAIALRSLIQTNASVIRDGREILIPDTKVVPGDIIVLEEGDKIPADARIIELNALRVDEAALTGEAGPVIKTVGVIKKTSVIPSEQTNMLFKGTVVVGGRARALVVTTGSLTEIGAISQRISTIDTEIPLRKEIRKLSRQIMIVVAFLIAILFFIGLTIGYSINIMFGITIALAISIIPEGLPVALTLVLASGVWRMSKRNVLVKKLNAVEALGQVHLIAVDKTGTLTRNELTVRRVYTQGSLYNVEGNGYEPVGSIKQNSKTISPLRNKALTELNKIAVHTANAHLHLDETTGMWRVSGDPTEAAMIVLSEKIGEKDLATKLISSRTSELPFDYREKYHAVSYNEGGQSVIAIAGAPEAVLSHCTSIMINGRRRSITQKIREEQNEVLRSMLEQGLRVVAFANSEMKSTNIEITREQINNLTLIGWYGMEDSLRPEARDAVLRAKQANIGVVMITGDHAVAAEAIAKQAGIFKKGDLVVTGSEIEDLSDDLLDKKIARASVFARVTPEHKLRIIEAYKRLGKTVAMTGDGVNDAPALLAADLGVAMGRIGTEVAREAADIVLLDDNFGSIIAGVEEGRSIYYTIKKVIIYLFSTSAAEFFVLFGAIVFGLPLPLAAAQIIWLNFVTDGFITVALAMEPKETNLLDRTVAFTRQLLDRLSLWRMTWMAIPMAIGSLSLFYTYSDDPIKASSITLVVLAVFQWFNAWNVHADRDSIFSLHKTSNRWLIAATILVAVLQVLAQHLPQLQYLLRTTPLSIMEWLLCAIVAMSVVLFEEIRKLFTRRIA